MKFCYIDESGDTGTVPHSDSPVQPVLAIAAVVVDHSQLASLTSNFITLKQQFSPKLAARSPHRLNMILREMKGNDIRRDVATGGHRVSRRALTFLDRLMDMLEYHRVRIFGRVWIKRLAYPMDANAVFTSSTQAICRCFQEYLTIAHDTGIVIADSRAPNLNIPVAHSIFTQKFKITGDAYDRILEMPTFGHSNNHVGLQLADLLVSALLFPMACKVYCSGHITNTIHVKPEYAKLRDRYGQRLKRLQFRYKQQDRWRGGITVSDDLGQQSGSRLFGDPPPPSSPSAFDVVATVTLPQPILLPDPPIITQGPL